MMQHISSHTTRLRTSLFILNIFCGSIKTKSVLTWNSFAEVDYIFSLFLHKRFVIVNTHRLYIVFLFEIEIDFYYNIIFHAILHC